MMTVRKLSPRALDYALDLAAKLGASITLLHVTDVPVQGPELAPYAPPDVAEQLADMAIAGLRKIVETRRDRGIAIESVLRVGVPWEQIVQEASAGAADLVVMAPHRRRGVARVLHGSVTEKVFRVAPCPVVVVHGEPTAVEHAHA